jgi:hypothetical protein
VTNKFTFWSQLKLEYEAFRYTKISTLSSILTSTDIHILTSAVFFFVDLVFDFHVNFNFNFDFDWNIGIDIDFESDFYFDLEYDADFDLDLGS